MLFFPEAYTGGSDKYGGRPQESGKSLPPESRAGRGAQKFVIRNRFFRERNHLFRPCLVDGGMGSSPKRKNTAMAEKRRSAAARVLKGAKAGTRRTCSALKRRTAATEKGVHVTPALSAERSGSEPSEAYLNKVAVATRLGVKPKTVAEWANRGKLPAYRLGPYLRFKWAEVEERLAATCRVAKEEQKAESREQK